MTEICKNCKYFEKKSPKEASNGRCLRYPPVHVDYLGGVFQPEVNEFEDCGEHKLNYNFFYCDKCLEIKERDGMEVVIGNKATCWECMKKSNKSNK